MAEIKEIFMKKSAIFLLAMCIASVISVNVFPCKFARLVQICSKMLNSEFGMLNDGDGRGKNVKSVAFGHEKRQCVVAQTQCR